MANARELFDSSIKDAEDLLAHFDAQPKPPPPNAEVLKRAGLIMALTAWETYVEDRAHEKLLRNPDVAKASLSGRFMQAKLEEELKRFHNPDSNKTRKLFSDYTGIDVTTGWKWAGYNCAAAVKKLDELLEPRRAGTDEGRAASGEDL
jgi:hypothetical protein